MKLLIVVHHRLDLWNVPGWFGERLAKEFPSLEIVIRNSYEGIEEHLREAEIIFTLSLRPAQFAQASKLRWLHAPSAAVHQLLFPESIKSDLVITNSREVHGPVVAEHVELTGRHPVGIRNAEPPQNVTFDRFHRLGVLRAHVIIA